MAAAPDLSGIVAATPAQRRAAVDAAYLPPLLPALVALTGDLTLLRDEFRPDPDLIREEQGGLTAEQQDGIRTLAAGVLDELAAGTRAPAPLDPDAYAPLLAHVVGAPIPDDYLPLVREELGGGADGVDLRTPDWTVAEVAPERRLRVVIVGAGMSGILAAHRFVQLGAEVTVFEKNDDVGGTWLENTYPGCRVDVSNHFYSYSFVQKPDWPLHFSSRDVLLDYFRQCADDFGIRDRIRFRTEVTSATWDDGDGVWRLAIRGEAGDAELEADVVISAVGQLNQPRYPDVPGRDTFAGPSFHSARWDPTVDLDGRRLVVIGTGASAAQFIPVVADRAASTTIVQRTAPWFIPTPDYHEEVPEPLRWLFEHVPGANQWHRFWLFWRSAEGLLPYAAVDTDWDGGERSVSAANEEIRALLQMYLDVVFAERPDLLEQCTPDYPPLAKRFIRDNGAWPATLQRDDVDLVSGTVAAIRPDGVELADGTHLPAEVIIYGTGFRASEFLTPMTVTGRDGVDLHEQWAGDARAHLGVAMPNFPNFFALYGPNTNIVVNGSIIFFTEAEVHLVTELCRLLLTEDKRSIEVRADAHDTYNAEIDERNLAMAWGASSVSSWYKAASGRVAQNWPGSLLEFWQRTREPERDAYILR